MEIRPVKEKEENLVRSMVSAGSGEVDSFSLGLLCVSIMIEEVM
ncbi:hypothetical protein EA438_10410, partial [Streptococcus dysgalactiae subsp. dysgalactiae]|nr:hypothetical protein [Streptococcus dysgalactiae subsp. dysgalactiae]